MKKLVLPVNTIGRDFIVGDIHGCLTELHILLNYVNFNENDRLICTGDLVDRGPRNVETLDFFINTPNVYSVKGNHDLYLEHCLKQELRLTQDTLPHWLHGSIVGYTLPWISLLSDTSSIFMHMHKYYEYLSSMPHIISVQSSENTEPIYHVVHSELTSNEKTLLDICKYYHPEPNDTLYSDLELEKNKKITNESIKCRELIDLYDEYTFLLKRDIFYFNEMKKQDQALTYSGHNALDMPQQLGRQVIIDTGICYAYDEDVMSKGSYVPKLSLTEALSDAAFILECRQTESEKISRIITEHKIKDFNKDICYVPSLQDELENN